jgi:transcriptional regulator with XRE-family HTH domain
VDEVDGDNPDPSTRASRATLSAQRRRYVGSRVMALREQRGLSLEDLGSRVGLSAGVLKAVESGRRGVTFECLIDIANELGVAASDLVEGME